GPRPGRPNSNSGFPPATPGPHGLRRGSLNRPILRAAQPEQAVDEQLHIGRLEGMAPVHVGAAAARSARIAAEDAACESLHILAVDLVAAVHVSRPRLAR